MTGERGRPGERGQRGDHGQHGDEGGQGRTGEAGERGARGDIGERGPLGDTGGAGPQGRRGKANWLPYALMGIFVAIGFALMEAEQIDRRDQNCRLFEGSHLRDVEQLQSTYDYLERIDPRTADPALTERIVQNLPQTEDRARKDSAPEYCDETTRGVFGVGEKKQIGLAEPDPVLPERRDFRYLLNP